MKISAHIFKFLILSLLLSGCQKPDAVVEERAPSGSDNDKILSVDPRGFNPLELPDDRVIIPKAFPNSTAIGSIAAVDNDTSDSSLSAGSYLPPPKLSFDTVNSQSYRIQLATTKLFGEARHIVSIAEEIFDQPLFVDFEVPYFKVRVGSFSERSDAEEYKNKCRSAGYGNAWVVVVNLNVKKLAPLYDDLPVMVPEEIISNDSIDFDDKP